MKRTALLIFGLLCLNHLFWALSSNQENYFALAYALRHPDWMPGSFLFTEHTGTRGLFNLLVGPALDHWSFENVGPVLTMLAFLLMSWPIARILQASLLHFGFIALWTQCILLGSIGDGAFFGDEWMFGDFEPKVIAYACFWWALWWRKSHRPWPAVALSVVATYSHVLVGGQTFVLLWAATLWETRDWKAALRQGLVYSVFVVPFLIVILRDVSYHDTLRPSLDWIYTDYRNPHHTAPFKSLAFFLHRNLYGVGGSIAVLVALGLAWKRQLISVENRFLARICALSGMLVLGGLVIAAVDREGHLLKYYLFRLSVVEKFTAFILLGSFIAPKLTRVMAWRWSTYVMVGVALYLGVDRFSRRGWATENVGLEHLTKLVGQHVDPRTQILNLFENGQSIDGAWDSLPRLSRRDWYVSYKFVPAGGAKLREWYNRIQRVQTLRLHPEQISPSEFPAILGPTDLPLKEHHKVGQWGTTALYVSRPVSH